MERFDLDIRLKMDVVDLIMQEAPRREAPRRVQGAVHGAVGGIGDIRTAITGFLA